MSVKMVATSPRADLRVLIVPMRLVGKDLAGAPQAFRAMNPSSRHLRESAALVGGSQNCLHSTILRVSHPSLQAFPPNIDKSKDKNNSP
jgi:hypothetical protein